MTRCRIGVALTSSLLVLAGCGGAGEDPGVPAATPPPVVEPDDGATGEGGDDAAGDGVGTEDGGGDAEGSPVGEDGDATVLLGRVGTPEDPEAFVITLTDESGEEVTTLPAGDYVVQVTDPATTHNFRLTGGSVDEATSVPDTEDAVFEVTLEPGEYTYRCDPHPPMTGTFTVTD